MLPAAVFVVALPAGFVWYSQADTGHGTVQRCQFTSHTSETASVGLRRVSQVDDRGDFEFRVNVSVPEDSDVRRIEIRRGNRTVRERSVRPGTHTFDELGTVTIRAYASGGTVLDTASVTYTCADGTATP